MFNDDKFMKGFNMNPNKFFDGYVPLKEIKYTIIIIYNNNFQKEIYEIENPWAYIKEVKKNPQVKDCYFK